MILGLMMMLASAPGQQEQSKAAEAAEGFSLELSPPAEQPQPAKDPATLEEQVAPDITPPPAADASTPPPRNEAEAGALAGAETVSMPVTLSLDTPIKELVADKRGRAVLDADMEGLSTDPNLPKFEDKSLREFQPLTGGQLTDAMMQTLARDLADPSKIMAAAEKKRKKEAEMGR